MKITSALLFFLLLLWPITVHAEEQPTHNTDLDIMYQKIATYDFRDDTVLPLQKNVLTAYSKDGTETADLAMKADPVPLETVWTIAFLRNPDLEAMRQMIRARAEMYPQVMAIEALAAQNRSFLQGINTRTSMTVMNESPELLFPGPGILSFNGRLAHLEVEMAMQEYTMKLRDIGADLLALCAERESYRKSLLVLSDMLRLFSAFEDSLKTRFVTNQAMYPEVARFQAERARMIAERETMKRMMDSFLARINHLLGRPTLAPIGNVRLPHPSKTPDFNSSLDEALEHRQELHIQRLTIDILQTLSQLKHRATLSPLSPGFAYPKPAMEDMSEKGRMTKKKIIPDPLIVYRQTFRTEPSAGLSNNYQEQIAFLRELDHRIKAEEAREEEMKNDTSARLADALAEYTNSLLKETTERKKVLPILQQGLESTTASFRTGKVSFLEWLELFMKVLQSKLDVIQYSASAFKSLAEIHMLRGTLR